LPAIDARAGPDVVESRRDGLHRRGMNETTEPRGFSFPDTFEVTAFGPAIPELEAIVLSELTRAGVRPDAGSVRHRKSSAGNYLAVTVSFWCEDRGHYENAYARLRAHPAVRWTL
jgi:putative lipoic acid-binding regulatory protein